MTRPTSMRSIARHSGGLCIRTACVLIALGATLTAQQRTAPHFYDDDPVARVADTQDASGVKAREISLTFDASINLFGRPGLKDVGRAEGINTIDEVPDSSWFT